MNYAYITLLSSENYLPAVLILNRSLKNVQSKFPLIVIIEENILSDFVKQIFLEECICFYTCKKMEYSATIREKYSNSSLLNTASKVEIFSLKQYDKLVYIDADSIIYQNIDNLFNYPDTALYDSEQGEEGFSGLMVVCPKLHKEKYYKKILQDFAIFDGDLFNDLFLAFKTNKDYRIPINYFMNYNYLYLEQYDLNSLKGVHFCYSFKPWFFKNYQNFLDSAEEKTTNQRKILKHYYALYLLPLWKKYPKLKQI